MRLRKTEFKLLYFQHHFSILHQQEMKCLNFDKIVQHFYVKCKIFRIFKDNLIELKNKIQQKLDEYFIFENSLIHLQNLFKCLSITSIGFDEINYGIKNSLRFKICVLVCILTWINSFHFIPFLVSNQLFISCMYNEFLPPNISTFFSMVVLLTSLIAYIRTEFLLAQIKFDLKPFKIFYFLKNNFRAKHKLSNLNYKRLAKVSRICIFFLVDYGTTIGIIIAISFNVLMAILSRKIFWVFDSVFMTPIYVYAGYTSAAVGIMFIIFLYYKIRFDQINSQINNGLPNGNWKVISLQKEKQLTSLIHEHNSLSIEIYKLNLMMRRLAAALFSVFSVIKIISLYLMINMDNIFIRINLINFFVIFFIFGFALSYLFTLQIKSAHNGLEMIYSILCNYKMRLSFKFKVS